MSLVLCVVYAYDTKRNVLILDSITNARHLQRNGSGSGSSHGIENSDTITHAPSIPKLNDIAKKEGHKEESKEHEKPSLSSFTGPLVLGILSIIIIGLIIAFRNRTTKH